MCAQLYIMVCLQIISTKLCESLKVTFLLVASKAPSYMVHEQKSYLFMPVVDSLFATHLPPNYTATLLDLSLLDNLFFFVYSHTEFKEQHIKTTSIL